jgi:hypothetical protein
MPILKGFLPIEGTMGNLTFMKTEDGYVVKTKSEVSAERIANDPNYERTRENNKDFGRAGKAGKLLYAKAREVVLAKGDKKVFSRLQKVMMSIIKSDQTNVRGSKTVTDGDLQLLKGFEFNRNAQLGVSLFADHSLTIERLTGNLEVTIPSFVPKDMVQAPQDTTHFRFVTGGMEIDFANETCVREKQYSAWLPWGTTATAPLTLTCTLTPNSTLPLIQLLGIEYAEEDAGVKYPLKNGAYNTVAIVKLEI